MITPQHITLAEYFMGRETRYPKEYTDALKLNAETTVLRVNKFLTFAIKAGCVLERHSTTNSAVSSGWRPALVNANTKNAAQRSKHITGEACDVFDPDGDLDMYAITTAGLAALESCGLWLEHPSATKGWMHVQTVPPNSQRRVFYP